MIKKPKNSMVSFHLRVSLSKTRNLSQKQSRRCIPFDDLTIFHLVFFSIGFGYEKSFSPIWFAAFQSVGLKCCRNLNSRNKFYRNTIFVNEERRKNVK